MLHATRGRFPSTVIAYLLVFHLFGDCQASASTGGVNTNIQPQQTGPLRIGVLDLEDNGVGEFEARAISDRLRFALGNHPVFLVLERKTMKEIMEEQGFQLSGACSTDECVVEIGRIVGANKMIAGSISRVGGLYSLNVRIVDITTSVVEHRSVSDVSSIEDALQTSTVNVARELALSFSEEQTPVSRQQATQATRAETALLGSIQVETNPPGAEVYIDNRLAGTSPAVLSVPVGRHLLRLSLPGFMEHESQVDAFADERNQVQIDLQPAKPSTLYLLTNPPGATVYVDGIEKGTTPISDVSVSPGTHEVRFGLTGYAGYMRTVEVEAGKSSSLKVSLVRIDRLSLPEQRQVPAASGANGFKVFLGLLLLGGIGYAAYKGVQTIKRRSAESPPPASSLVTLSTSIGIPRSLLPVP